MYKIGLLDASFAHQESVSLGGDNRLDKPKLMQWIRGPRNDMVVLTDMFIDQVDDVLSTSTRIAMLVEPNSLSDTHYKKAMLYRDEYDCLFTFSRDITESEPDFLYYPLGGSWINPVKCGLHPKTKNISIIASGKTGAVGHRLRHSVVERFFDNRVGVYGGGYNYINSKDAALRDYRYSVVIESCQMRGYFSEKIVDCISMGSVPIYWGCPDIGDFFDRRGILSFQTIDELEHIINDLATVEEYRKRLEYIQKNWDYSQDYRCSEDWIIKNYPFIFENCQND